MANYTYKCEGCGEKITTHIRMAKPKIHHGCPKGVDQYFYRAWDVTPVIFKAKGYSKNNLTKRGGR